MVVAWWTLFFFAQWGWGGEGGYSGGGDGKCRQG